MLKLFFAPGRTGGCLLRLKASTNNNDPDVRVSGSLLSYQYFGFIPHRAARPVRRASGA